jgi:hypothetical protein
MSKLLALFLVAAAVGFSAFAAPAMPLGSNRTQANLIVPVASGCGIGVHRGPYNGCRPVYGGYYNGYYNGYRNGQLEGYYEGFHDAYYGDYGPSYVVETGLCWGRGTHRVCNASGLCWRACN